MWLGKAFIAVVAAVLGLICGASLSLAINAIIVLAIVLFWLSLPDGAVKSIITDLLPWTLPIWLIFVLMAALVT
jgi:hypothetical protein